MAKKAKTVITSEQRDSYKIFQLLAADHGLFKVWNDFITLIACTLCPTNCDKRNKEYELIASRYTDEELRQFAEIGALLVISFKKNTEQDFLGSLFSSLNLHDTRKAQFFTPYSVSKDVAALVLKNLKPASENKPFISVFDPACGAGALLIAFANECLSQGINFQTNVLFVAQDIDRFVAMMCFIQLSLLGCAGYVVVGNSLTQSLSGPGSFLQAEKDGLEIWYTPMFFSSVWQSKIGIEKAKSMEESQISTAGA